MEHIKRHPLVLFFVLAILFPWLIWGTSIIDAYGLIGFHIPQPLAFWVGLTLATWISAAVTGGRAACLDLLQRMVRWRVSIAWYAIALLLTPLLSLIAILFYRPFGGAADVGSLLPLQQLLPYFLFDAFLFWMTEEPAWRGFALPRLQKDLSPLYAGLLLGLFWGVWHTPLFLLPGSFQSTIPFVGFVLSAIATSIQITWIFNHTRGSVLIAALFHAATDATIAYSNVMSGDLRLFWLFIAVQWIAALAIIFAAGSHFRAKQPLGETVFA